MNNKYHQTGSNDDKFDKRKLKIKILRAKILNIVKYWIEE
jgi:hypothetical protein